MPRVGIVPFIYALDLNAARAQFDRISIYAKSYPIVYKYVLSLSLSLSLFLESSRLYWENIMQHFLCPWYLPFSSQLDHSAR